jgi:hypothetical protein
LLARLANHLGSRYPHAAVRHRASTEGAQGNWLFYVATGVACTVYLNTRAWLVRDWGKWYMADDQPPYVLLQVRAFLSGSFALFAHPGAAEMDSNWGRGGMHQAWGLGVPILAVPFHLLGRLVGAPGFPDNVRFLILYCATTVVLARALHRASREGERSIVASCAAATFVMTFPTFVGLVSSRFLIYEQTIATGALWSVLLLAGVLMLVERCTPARLLVVCAGAGFSVLLRPPLAVYGLTTIAMACAIAFKSGLSPRRLVRPLLAYLGVTALGPLTNMIRFGSPLVWGYENSLSGFIVNRLTRWGLPFSQVPFSAAVNEMLATLFLLEPTPNHILLSEPPPSVRPFIVGGRWREYYAPTFGRVVFFVWVAAIVIVGWRLYRNRPWRESRRVADEVPTIVGLWGLVPSVVLFVFYARIDNMVTRYATDMYPAFVAAFVCVGMTIIETVRAHAPRYVVGAQVALAGLFVFYASSRGEWATHLSTPIDESTIIAKMAALDARSVPPTDVQNVLRCGEPGSPPVYSHLDGWGPDCTFPSGMVFALPHTPCVSFTFAPHSAPEDMAWSDADNEALKGLRVTGDFDSLVACGESPIDRGVQRITMCEPRTPTFLLDGLRLYSVASLTPELMSMDGVLRLLEIRGTTSCTGAVASR